MASEFSTRAAAQRSAACVLRQTCAGQLRKWRSRLRASALIAALALLLSGLAPNDVRAATVSCQGGHLYGGIAFTFDAYAGTCSAGSGTLIGGSFAMYYSNIGPQFTMNNSSIFPSHSGSASPSCTLFNVYPTDAKSKNLYTSSTASTCTDDVSFTDPYGNSVSFTHTSTNNIASGFTISYTPVPPPTISGIVANSGPTLGGTSITISGTNLLYPTVTIGGAAASVTVSSLTSITVTTPAHVIGAVDVVVTVPNGSVTSTSGFTYVKQSQAALTAVAAPSTLTFGSGTSALSTTGGSGTGAVTYSVVSGPCSIAGSTLSTTGAGTCSVTATKAADANYNVATSSPIAITVNKAVQSTPLSFTMSPTSLVYGSTATLSGAGGNGTGAYSFAVTLGGTFCSITGNVITATGVGVCQVEVTKATDANYLSAASNANISVSKASQASLAVSASPASIAFSGTSSLSTTGGSGTGAISYAVTTGASFCSISGSTLTGTGVGSCTVTAMKAADVNYTAITSAAITVTVSKATQTTAIAATLSPASVTVGSTATLSGFGGNGTGAFSYSVMGGASFCSISGAVVTGTNAGVCQIEVTKAGDANYLTGASNFNLTVGKAAQAALTASASLTSIAFNGTSTLSTTGGSGTGAVTYAVTAGGSFCSISGTTLTGTGVGTCTVTATKATDANYNSATATVDVSVGKAAQAALSTSASPASISFNGTTALSTSGGTGAGTVTYAVTAGSSFCSVTGTTLTGIGAGICTVTATKAGDANYNPANAMVNVTVGKASQAAITATASLPSIAFNGTSMLSALDGSGTGAMTYAVTTGGSICSISGTMLTGTGVGTCTVTATKAADANYDAATATVDVTVGKATQAALSAAASPVSIAFGGTSTISASGGSGTGSLSYAVTAGGSFCSISDTMLIGTGVGTCTITATKASDANYHAATAAVDVSVGKAAQSINFVRPTDVVFKPGTTILLSAEASSTLPVTFASQSTSICTVSGSTATIVAVGTCSMKASQVGDENYTAAPDVTVSFGSVATPDMSATATVSPEKFSRAGETLVFSITVKNAGGVTANRINLAEPRLSGITCSGTSVPAGGEVTCEGSTQSTEQDLTAGKISVSPKITFSYAEVLP